MPKKYKVLSGPDVIKILEGFGFEKVSQKGSHVKMCRISTSGDRQILILPDHKELSVGTLRAIYSQALKYLSEEDLRECFII